MSPKLRNAFSETMNDAIRLYRQGELDRAFAQLERAHILGQRHVIAHTRSHWWMLKIGLKRRDGREIRGQLLRIPAGIVGSALGRVPIGNTGGANVNPLQPMPIPEELQRFFE